LMAAGFKLFLLSVLILKIKTRLIRKRIRSIQMVN
jgi:hypothetical protein